MVIHAHIPFIKTGCDDLDCAGEEKWLFEAISETYLPIFQAFERLESDRVPFRIGLSITPILLQMLGDPLLQKKYLSYVDRLIEFGKQEIERTAGDNALNNLAKGYFEKTIEQRNIFTERYDGNLLNAVNRFKDKGKIEILASPATHAFLPNHISRPQTVRVQMELAIHIFRQFFGDCPQGFWLPELGWTPALEPFLVGANFGYTIVDSHGLMFGDPAPVKGCFYPVKTPGLKVFGRDFYAAAEIHGIAANEVYRDNDYGVSDTGQLPGCRLKYCYKYRTREGAIYDPGAAKEKAAWHAKTFLENILSRLREARKYMEDTPVSLCAHNAGNLGRFWYEGPLFLEALFRTAAVNSDVQFMTPAEYLYKQDSGSLQVLIPEFSSCGYNGYAETWLDASNDWIYRHLMRAADRMTELAERFPEDTGLKERALNQAAKEILLAQASDWPRLLYKQISSDYARSQIEDSLRNFTTIYEALGSNYISTEWLTSLERRHDVFTGINYRIFKRKK
jgi:1,4-alpha-glucan branching enzyme